MICTVMYMYIVLKYGPAIHQYCVFFKTFIKKKLVYRIPTQTQFFIKWHMYVAPKLNRNDPNFLDRQALANSADPDQTAPRGAV